METILKNVKCVKVGEEIEAVAVAVANCVSKGWMSVNKTPVNSPWFTRTAPVTIQGKSLCICFLVG